MDVQTVLDEIHAQNPEYGKSLTGAVLQVAASRILPRVVDQLKLDFVDMTSAGDEIEQILERIRELRYRIDILTGIQEVFSQVKQKEADDE